MTLNASSTETDALEQLSKVLKEDLIAASGLEDIAFIQKVIVPLLHTEKKCYLRLNILEGEKRLPIHFNPSSQGG